ncbi:MAG: haloacid dehalogenase type II [Alphaproteobacteria bacterium]
MATPKLEGIEACVFDAYGTLFDFNSAAERCRDVLGDKAAELSALWRTKQLQYTWLRGLMGKHKDFWSVTGDALDFSMQTLGLADDDLRARLMDCYMNIEAFAEVPGVLKKLKAAGIKTAILSNGTPRMLQGAVEATGTADLFDALISVEEVGVYKPHPSIYALPGKHLGVAPERISFQSSNAWDAVAAGTFGMNVVWINRYDQQPERLTYEPDFMGKTLDDLLPVLGL